MRIVKVIHFTIIHIILKIRYIYYHYKILFEKLNSKYENIIYCQSKSYQKYAVTLQ